MSEEKFDYKASMERLSQIVTTLENPATSIDEMHKLLEESRKLIAACRGYLRSERESLEKDLPKEEGDGGDFE